MTTRITIEKGIKTVASIGTNPPVLCDRFTVEREGKIGRFDIDAELVKVNGDGWAYEHALAWFADAPARTTGA